MKVLYFHQHFTTPKGGGGTRSYEMAKELIRRGHEVTVVCGSYGVGHTGIDVEFSRSRREGTVDGIRVIEFDLPYANRDGFVKRAWTFMRFAMRSIWVGLREDYDLVFATSTPLTAALPGIVARWLRRKRFVFEVRDLWPELPKAMGAITNPVILLLLAILERTAYASAHHCIGLAPGIVDGIARHKDRSLISSIPNGCDLAFFAPDGGASWRPESVPAENFLAVFTGAHGPANGLHAVLDAAAKLQQLGRTDISLLLIGDGKLKPMLMDRAKAESLQNIIFHDLVTKIKIAELLRSADVGMQILDNVPAFYFGTSPNKFFDYIASGLPVLNNYPGWLAELIQENQCGIAVKPEDPDEFAQALVKMADDRSRLLAMGEASRNLAETKFGRPELASQFVDVLEKAASS